MADSAHMQQVISAFESVADTFEESLENDITRRIRSRVHATIQALTPPPASVLDINCGIGIDAMLLAQNGYMVTAVDISPKMIEQAKKRAETYGTQSAEFTVASFEDLSTLGEMTFDLILSNFGGLNCTDALDIVGREVARVVRPGGYVVAIVMPPFCLWEVVAGIARLDAEFAFRRLRRITAATGFPGGAFRVHYHSPARVRKSFAASFLVEQLQGLNIFSPPPPATGFSKRYPRMSFWLEGWDDIISGIPLLRSMGDHYLMVLRRRTS